MSELLEKAKRDYPIGTKFKSVYDDEKTHTCNNEPYDYIGHIYVLGAKLEPRRIYDKDKNKWAEIINKNTMTQQEFNSLRVGEFISNYEILHKYKEFLIVRCEDGHDLFDLNKINKLGLKIKPKTFMGLEIKEYDNVPCEINGEILVYLYSVKEDGIVYSNNKTSIVHSVTPTSIRIL